MGIGREEAVRRWSRSRNAARIEDRRTLRRKPACDRLDAAPLPIADRRGTLALGRAPMRHMSSGV